MSEGLRESGEEDERKKKMMKGGVRARVKLRVAVRVRESKCEGKRG